MAALQIVDAGGTVHAVEAREGEPLMHALRDGGFVDAICGGAMSCGTCAVVIDPVRAAALGAADDMEAALIEGLGLPGGESRLSCQIIVTGTLAGATLRVLPPA